MITNQCYPLLMESMDGFIAEMERMGGQDSPKMSREHAKFLLITLYGAILSLVHGGTDLLSMSMACQIFEDFHFARVREAACLGIWKGKRLDEHITRLYAEFGEQAVLEATELQQEKSHAYGWMLDFKQSFIEVVNRPKEERAIGSVREAFLQRVEHTNASHANETRKGALHDLSELEATYHRLVSG